MDFEILKTERRHDGVMLITIRSYHDQNVMTAHNRWGSWMFGNPDQHGGRDMPFDWAAIFQRIAKEYKDEPVVVAVDFGGGSDNPFMAIAGNPFMQSDAPAASNPFMS